MDNPSFYRDLSQALSVFLLAATPFGELRASIPVAVVLYKMSAFDALFWSVLGNASPILLIYGLGHAWLGYVDRHKRSVWHRWTDRVLRRTHREFKRRYDHWGLVALTIFVALPLPFSGAWIASIAAFMFGIPLRKAFPFIFVGIIAAGFLMLFLTNGTVAAVNHLK